MSFFNAGAICKLFSLFICTCYVYFLRKGGLLSSSIDGRLIFGTMALGNVISIAEIDIFGISLAIETEPCFFFEVGLGVCLFRFDLGRSGSVLSVTNCGDSSVSFV